MDRIVSQLIRGRLGRPQRDGRLLVAVERHQTVSGRVESGLQREGGQVEGGGFVVVPHRRVDVGNGEVDDDKLGRDLQGRVGDDERVVVEAGAMQHVGQGDQRNVSHVLR